MSELRIRPETPADVPAIRALTESAFRDMPHSDGDEHELVDHLRLDGDLILSLVAEAENAVIGHIAFSPVTISDGTKGWFGLGPVSVLPARQGEGIGSRLIRRGIANMRVAGAKGLVLLGSNDYYPRFGFEHDPDLAYPGGPAEYFQRLVLAGEPPRGTVRFAPAFGD